MTINHTRTNPNALVYDCLQCLLVYRCHPMAEGQNKILNNKHNLGVGIPEKISFLSFRADCYEGCWQDTSLLSTVSLAEWRMKIVHCSICSTKFPNITHMYMDVVKRGNFSRVYFLPISTVMSKIKPVSFCLSKLYTRPRTVLEFNLIQSVDLRVKNLAKISCNPERLDLPQTFPGMKISRHTIRNCLRWKQTHS